MIRRAKRIVRELPVVGAPFTRAYRAVSPSARRERGLPPGVDLAPIERSLHRHPDPVLGPWGGGLETELLYWIPFLRLLVERGSVDPQRLRVTAEPWKGVLYAGVGRTCDDGATRDPALPAKVERLVRPYRDGHAGASLPLRLGVVRPLERPEPSGVSHDVLVAGEPEWGAFTGLAYAGPADLPRIAAGEIRLVVGTWSEAVAVALFARVATVVVEPRDPVLRRDVALAERVAQRLAAPFSVVQPAFAARFARGQASSIFGGQG